MRAATNSRIDKPPIY